MITPSQMTGATIDVRTTTPSIHLTPIVKALTELVSSHDYLQLSLTHPNRLLVDSKIIINQLIRHPALKEFDVVADLTELPKIHTSATLGGTLYDDPVALSRQIDKLYQQIDQQLTRLPAQLFENLTIANVESYLAQLSYSMVGNNALVPKSRSSFHVQPIAFTDHVSEFNTQANNVARVFYAQETINAQNWLDSFKKSVNSWMRKEDYDDEVIDDIVSSIEFQKENPNSQMASFVSFLDDMALSRVRLQVVMDLMSALAKHSSDPLLTAYVDNVRSCYQLFAGQAAKTVSIDVSQTYGSRTHIDLMSYFNNIYAYANLPVWAEPSVQLFENINENSQGFLTCRDVTYQFKVNGKAMQAEGDKTAFVNKIDKLKERLLVDNIDENDSYTFDILELIFLSLVVPSEDSNKHISVEEKLNHIQQGIIRESPKDYLKKLYDLLEQRSDTVDKIALALIGAIKSKSKQVISDLAKHNNKYILTIDKDIINSEAIESSDGEDNIEILKKSKTGKDVALWLNHVRVLRSDELAQNPALVSYTVTMQLGEKSISKAANLANHTYERLLSNQVLPVRLLPTSTKPKFNYCPLPNAGYLAVNANVRLPDTQGGVDVHYWLDALHRRSEQQELSDHRKSNSKDKLPTRMRGDQLHTTGLVALNILLYITLHAIIQKIKALTHQPLSVNILRIPATNPDDIDENNKIRHMPDDIIYASSRALEYTLSRDTLTKVQGMVMDNFIDDFRNFKKTGLLKTLLTSQPLLIERQGSLNKIAVIVYVTRPADIFPDMPADKQGYLFTSKTFVADVKDDKRMCVSVDSMRTHLINNAEAFDQPPVLNEIARLNDLGYHDIILVSHHVQGRKIGRTAKRHIRHLSKAFLEQVNSKFKDINLYPLIREEFSAVRLKQRMGNESGFEVVGLHNHQSLFNDYHSLNQRELTPLYTFATLNVVGSNNSENHKRPQSGFATYFFNHDSRVEGDRQKAEILRANALGLSATDTGVRDSIVSILRSLHVLECEKSVDSKGLLPVLDPFAWVKPKDIVKNGEVLIMSSKRKGKTQLSLAAILSHVSSVLHKD